VQRGDVFEAKLDPVEGSEQGGVRPVVIVSRDTINTYSPIVIIAPISKLANFARVYPSQLTLQAGAGGLTMASVVMAEQVRTISKTRLTRQMGSLSPTLLQQLDEKLKIALGLSDRP
jgi:mRNA interferase MazF